MKRTAHIGAALADQLKDMRQVTFRDFASECGFERHPAFIHGLPNFTGQGCANGFRVVACVFDCVQDTRRVVAVAKHPVDNLITGDDTVVGRIVTIKYGSRLHDADPFFVRRSAAGEGDA